MPDQRIPAVIRGTSSSADGWCQVSAQYICTGKQTESIEDAYLFANMATPDLIAFLHTLRQSMLQEKNVS